MHLPTKCRLGLQRVQQTPTVASSASIAAAAAAIANPQFQTLLTTISAFQSEGEDELCYTPAHIWAYLFACVAGPFYLDTGQMLHFITYLLIIYLPTIVIMLLHLAVPEDPQSRHAFANATRSSGRQEGNTT